MGGANLSIALFFFTIASMHLWIGLLSVIRDSGVSAILGVLMYWEIYGVTVRTFRTVRYNVGVRYRGVSVKRVPPYIAKVVREEEKKGRKLETNIPLP